MSLPEVLLWRELKGHKPKFRKQFPVAGYVADFACTSARLLVEIDGVAHDMGDRPQLDAERDNILRGKGWRILRIPASEVLRSPACVAQSLLQRAEDL